MESTLEYLARMNDSLNNNYRTPNGRFAESCLHIAGEVAKRLISEGKRPSINFVGRIVEDGKVDKPMLLPKRYHGNVQWACHLFAVCDNQVWDPMIGQPVLMDSYVDLAFGKNCSEIKIWASYGEVLARVMS